MSNQIRVFQGTIQNLKLTLGDTFAEPFRKALIYVNGFLIGINDAIRAFKGLTTSTGNPLPLEKNIDNTNKKLDETEEKLGLLSIDKFNVLNNGERAGEQAENLAITEALTQELRKQQEDYDKIRKSMETVTNEATKIAKKVRDWFVIIDEETGVAKLTQNAQNLLNVLKSIATLGIVALVGKISKLLISLIKPTSLLTISLTIIVTSIYKLIHGWDDMSGWQRATTILIGAAAAIIAVTAAIAAFQGTWSLGLALPAIVAGITAVTLAISSFWNDTKNNLDIPAYANGGTPDVGSLFYAGEAGAELVANVGGQTNVINMQQLTKAVADGSLNTLITANQMGLFGDGNEQQPIIVNLDGKQIYNSVKSTAKSYGESFIKVR